MSSSASVTTLFTDRHGGVSAPPYDSLNLGGHVGDVDAAVSRNRAALAARLGVQRVVWMNQVHGDRVAVVDEDGVVAAGVDALVTARSGVALGVLVADCVPVLMADPDAGVVGAVHAGRPGARNGVVLRALEAMVSLGADVSRVDVVLGPAVCGACYEVPAQMQHDVGQVVPDAVTSTRWGTPGLDLRRGIGGLLRGLVGSIEMVGPCTMESPDHFSYRREGVTGRFAGVVRFGR